jgi:sigma-B regulation protein RsbU (phosphoserine phosphatase)
VVVNEGCWIGLVKDDGAHVQDLFVPMGPGDLALFFTDGATEAQNARGEMYGEERLAAALARVAGMALEDALAALLAEVAGFRGQEQDDDVTLLLVRRAGAGATSSTRLEAAAEREPAPA